MNSRKINLVESEQNASFHTFLLTMNLTRLSDLRRIAFWFITFLLILVFGWRACENWHSCYSWRQSKHDVATTPPDEKHFYQENIQVSRIDSNCGIEEICLQDSFPVHLSTGQPEEPPQLCIGGKVLTLGAENGTRRGLNAAIVEPIQFQIISVRHFDTYRYDSSVDMDIWLEDVLANEILIIFTSDEASTKLNSSTKSLLNDLGSGKVQDLSYRAQWFAITQKAGKGFTIYEKISFPRNRSWGDRLEFRGCVPREIPKKPHTVDPPLRVNQMRSRFCQERSEDKFRSLCTLSRFESIMPALMTNRTLIGNKVLSLPIYLFAGVDFEVLLAALESLLHQPGVLQSVINVVYNSTWTDVKELVKLFGMNPMPSDIKFTWESMISFARNTTASINPSQSYFIIIGPDTIPSPDFLFFFAQTSYSLFQDESLSSISAWSPNCYNSQGDVHLAFRVHGTPRYGALMNVKAVEGDIVVPDVSRVQGSEACQLPSLKADNWIDRPQDFVADRYFHKLVMLQQKSQNLDVSHVLDKCLLSLDPGNYVLYLKDDSLLGKILNCFGVIGGIAGQYQKIIRLSLPNRAYVMIIGSNSTFFKARPII